MNDKITSLLNVCGMPNEELLEIYADYNKSFYMQEFAELIIKRCISIVEDSCGECGSVVAIKRLKEEFGVD